MVPFYLNHFFILRDLAGWAKLVTVRFTLIRQASRGLKHICIPETDEHLGLVAGYYMRLGVWHNRGLFVDRDSLLDPKTNDLFINRMGFVLQSNWQNVQRPKIRTESEARPHFSIFSSERIQRIVLVGMWWRPEARDQRGYWDVNPAQGGGCFLMNDQQAPYGGFPIHLSLVRSPSRIWKGLVDILNKKYPGCRIGFIPLKAYYHAESSSEYLPAIVWPNIKDNLSIISDICTGCRDLHDLFSANGTKPITDPRWPSIELLWKRGKYWTRELHYKEKWPQTRIISNDISLINPKRGKKIPAAWADLICWEWDNELPLQVNTIKINQKLGSLERRTINVSCMTISRIIDRYLPNTRNKKPVYSRGNKELRLALANAVKGMYDNGHSALAISRHLEIPERRVYRLLNLEKS